MGFVILRRNLCLPVLISLSSLAMREAGVFKGEDLGKDAACDKGSVGIVVATGAGAATRPDVLAARKDASSSMGM